MSPLAQAEKPPTGQPLPIYKGDNDTITIRVSDRFIKHSQISNWTSGNSLRSVPLQEAKECLCIGVLAV
jgi:hypothetical protein